MAVDAHRAFAGLRAVIAVSLAFVALLALEPHNVQAQDEADLAVDVLDTTRGDAIRYATGKVPMVALDGADCSGQLIESRGYSTYGNVGLATDGSDAFQIVSRDRLLTMTPSVGGSAADTRALAAGNGVLVSSPGGASWEISLQPGERLVQHSQHAIVVEAADGTALLAVGVPAAGVDDQVTVEREQTGDIVIRERVGNGLPAEKELQLLFAVASEDPDLTQCTSTGAAQAAPEYCENGRPNYFTGCPEDEALGPPKYSYYGTRSAGDAQSSARRLAYCFTDTNDNTPYYSAATGGVVQANVRWYCRNGTRERVVESRGRADLMKQFVFGPGSRIWGRVDRVVRRKNGPGTTFLDLFRNCTDGKYRTQTRLNYFASLRGQIPDSPLYKSPARTFSC